MNLNDPKRISRRIFLTLVSATLLAGCTGLQAPRVDSPLLYLLDARSTLKAVKLKRDLVLAVTMPRARPGFDTPRMAYLRQPHELDYFVTSRWVDTPSRMLGPLLAQALEQTGSFRAIVQTPGVIPADIRLDTELIRMQQEFRTQPSRVQLTRFAEPSSPILCGWNSNGTRRKPRKTCGGTKSVSTKRLLSSEIHSR